MQRQSRTGFSMVRTRRLLVLVPLLTAALFVPMHVGAQSSALPTLAEQEEAVRNYFADIPAMVEIAECESSFRQYTDAGNVLRGGYGNKMLGVFQLHEDYHLEAAQAMGLDITNLDGNLAYAMHLYEAEGLTPWAPCLHAVSEANKADATAGEAKEVTEGAGREALFARIADLQRQVYMLRIKILTMHVASLRAQL